MIFLYLPHNRQKQLGHNANALTKATVTQFKEINQSNGHQWFEPWLLFFGSWSSLVFCL